MIEKPGHLISDCLSMKKESQTQKTSVGLIYPKTGLKLVRVKWLLNNQCYCQKNRMKCLTIGEASRWCV